MGKQITNHTQVNANSHAHTVVRHSAIKHTVISGSSGDEYTVMRLWQIENAYSCNCRWGNDKPDEDRRSMCSHVVAVVRSVAEANGMEVQIMSKEGAAWYQDAEDYGDGTYVVHTKIQSFEELLEELLEDIQPPQWAEEDYDQGEDLLFMSPGVAGMQGTTSKSW